MNRLISMILVTSALFLPRLHAVDFAHEVMPILQEHCGECHTDDKKKGGLAMNTRAELLAGGENGKVVVPGDAANSLFLELIHSKDSDEWMPPKGPRMPGKQVDILTKWINEGMPWEAGILLGKSSWEPPLKPRHIILPAPSDGREHPIDRLLDADLSKNKQSPPSPVTDAEFLRRASLDIVGLLPTPDELGSFTADPTSNKREKLIDKLLANEIGYADHWLTTWNDLLRNDYTGTGFITKGRTQITNWLYASLRSNKPYDQLAEELISPEAESAGFINGIKWRGEVNSSQTREIQFAQNVSQVFLGINMKCASCHDSFIDRWSLSDAYNLASIYADSPLELNRCDKPTGEMSTPKWIFPEIGNVDPKAPKTERLKQLAGLMTHPENGRFTRTLVNRIWDRLMGRGIVHPVDAMDTEPWNENLLDYLAVRFAEDEYDLRKLIRFIMTSQAYQSRTVILESEPGRDYVYAGPIAKRMTAEQLLDSIWQITEANPAQPTAEVDRTIKTRGKQTSKPEELKAVPVSAKWIWHEGTTGTKSQIRKRVSLDAVPKVARIMATCDNIFVMKINGTEVASSREWSKPVYRDITPFLLKGDNVISVDAKMVGGAAGFICELVMSDGKTQRSIATDNTWEARPPGKDWATARELKPHGSAPWGDVLKPQSIVNLPARSGPTPPVRAALVKNDFLMRSLGRPHRDQVVTTRPAELTTLQAIDLSNGEILANYLKSGAKHLQSRGKSGGELIGWLYQFALSREPTAGERNVLLEVVGDGRDLLANEDLLWSVFMLPEFQIIR